MTSLILSLVLIMALFLVAPVACDCDIDDEEEEDDDEDWIASARETCEKYENCFPINFGVEYNSLDECEDDFADSDADDVYCYRCCRTDVTCSAWEGCIHSNPHY